MILAIDPLSNFTELGAERLLLHEEFAIRRNWGRAATMMGKRWLKLKKEQGKEEHWHAKPSLSISIGTVKLQISYFYFIASNHKRDAGFQL